MKARVPAPKGIDPKLGVPVMFHAGPGRFYVGRLVGYAWQEDCDPPPDMPGRWAWMEVTIEFDAEVNVEIAKDKAPFDVSLPSMNVSPKQWVN